MASSSRQSSKRSRPSSSSSSPDLTTGVRFRSEAQKSSFYALLDRKHLVTKFLNRNTLDILGLEDSVIPLLEKGGLARTMGRAVPSYPQLTLEFISSLEKYEESVGGTSIYFRLGNQPKSMTYAQLSEALNWDHIEEEWEVPGTFRVEEFWNAMTHAPFLSTGNNSSAITHPSLRIVYRFMAMAIFGHGEPNKTNRTELTALWSMTPNGVGRPNWTNIFVLRCLELQRGKPGKISLGGLVALIARYLDIDIPDHCSRLQSDTGTFYDLESLRRMKLIDFKGSRFSQLYYLCGATPRRHIRLPSPLSLVITNDNDTLFVQGENLEGMAGPQLLEDEPEQEEQPQPQPEAQPHFSPQPQFEPHFQNQDWVAWRDSVDQRLDFQGQQLMTFGNELGTIRSNQEEMLRLLNELHHHHISSFPPQPPPQ